MHVDVLFGEGKLEAAAEDGLVTRVQHPTNPNLYIYNYTRETQWEKRWTPVTVACRGLVVDHSTNEIVARPFPKFWNLGEVTVGQKGGMQNLPARVVGAPAATFEKMDGSLGITYWEGGAPHVATRGSFTSDQALWATNWLHDNLDLITLDRLPDGLTPLFEIIYPDNRIVIDYGDREGLVLLGAIDIATGVDQPLWEIDWWDGERADIYPDLRSFEDATGHVDALDGTENEGFVLCWYHPDEPTARVKVKNSEYVRLHHIIHGTSTKSIWRELREGGDLSDILDAVPDEFDEWVRDVQTYLVDRFNEIYNNTLADFVDVNTQWNALPETERTRKAFADLARQKTNTPFMFSMLDNKPVHDSIWKMIEPDYELPFSDGESA